MTKNSSRKYRVAIIGAGAIGLYLSWKLSKLGHGVTCFEKNKEVGQKPCSGLISERIKNFIPPEESLVENRIDSCLIHFPGKTINLKLKPIHFAINRQKLDQHLYRLAQEAGAEILLNHFLKGIPPGFDRVIGCDGVLSIVRRDLGLPNPSFYLGFQGFKAIENHSSRVEVWPTPHQRAGEGSGFFWKIPRGKKIEYGFIGDPKTAQREFKQQLSLNCEAITVSKANGLILGKEGLEDIKGAMIPQGLVIPKSKNITLCGDAMGFCKPWSGGGVIWGLTAADILLKHFPDFEKYHREVKRFFGFKVFKGKLINNLVYFLGNNFPWILPSKISRDNDFPFL